MSQDYSDIGSHLVVALSSIIIGLVIGNFIAGKLGPSLGTLASVITIIGGVIAGHRSLKKLDINIVGLLVGESDGTDYGIFFVPTISGLEKNRKLANEILDSPDWHFDGHGNHPNSLRWILSKLFESQRFSNRRMEIVILSITTLSLSLFLVILADVLGGLSTSPGYLRFISQVYPDSLSINQSAIPLFVSIFGFMLGFSYLHSKSSTTCPEGVPFSLKSEGRYYRKEDLQRETRRDNEENTYEVTVAYGKQVYHCLEHDEYFVRSGPWIID